MLRYTLHIYFKDVIGKDNQIIEKFKTLKEAKLFSVIVDDSVQRAYIEDNITSKIIIDII